MIRGPRRVDGVYAIMRAKRTPWLRRLLIWLTALMLLVGLPPGTRAEDSSDPNYYAPLVPEDLTYDDGNIVLHKNAERIGPEEWKVTVSATIGEQAVEKPKMEVVFVLDLSGSMNYCTLASHSSGAGHASHTIAKCYKLICEEEEHTHSEDSCYADLLECEESDHYDEDGSHISDTECIAVEQDDGTILYYQPTCGESLHTHTLAAGCYELTCKETLYEHGSSGSRCWRYVNGTKKNYTTRLYYAKNAITSMVKSWTPNSTSIKYVVFSSANNSNGVGKTTKAAAVSSLANVKAAGSTYMYAGIKLGLEQFSDNDYKKVLVVVADGAAEDSDATVASVTNSLTDFKNNGGTVFSVGFVYNAETLAAIAGGEGGKYVYATDEVELAAGMENIQTTITAMLEDPMGPAVGFEATSIITVSDAKGEITTLDDTIFWHPQDDDASSVNNSKIEYYYNVGLTSDADRAVGEHLEVPLNNPTYFRYGTQKTVDGVTTTEMQEVPFPIPKAKYELSSVQTVWQGTDADGGTVQLDSRDEECVISDYTGSTSSGGNYTPKFTQDYANIPATFPIEGSNNYYRYVSTTVTATDAEGTVTTLAGLTHVDATQSVAYNVVHQYELVEAGTLIVSGTKNIVGRDFEDGDSFTFTLAAVTEGAPLPGNTSVTIEPSTGKSAVFSFDAISFTEKGTYEYTLTEVEGTNTELVYDDTVRTLVVTVTEHEISEDNTELIVTYTIDGENKNAEFTNSLLPGRLKVTKATVTSHLPDHQQKTFGFVIKATDKAGLPLSGIYPLTLDDGSSSAITFSSGQAAVQLAAGQSATVEGLPEGTAYTVTEDSTAGFTAAATDESGTIEANVTSEASFTNTYASSGSYQFTLFKQLFSGADGTRLTLTPGQYSFEVLDAAGETVATGTNNADGNVFMTPTLTFTHEDLGGEATATKTYTVKEVSGDVTGVVYDTTEHKVTLTLTDNGSGTIGVTADNTNPTFTNRYWPLTITKTVAGNMGSKNREFPFTLTVPDQAGKTVSISTDGGATFTEQTLDDDGKLNFTLKGGQSLIVRSVTGAFTVTETEYGSYTPSCTVNGGDAVQGASVTGTNTADGSTVAFTNTLEVPLPTGVRTPYASALAGMLLALMLLTIPLIGRRRARID